MTLYCRFNTQREACYAVDAVAKRMGIKLTARPYNRFQPEDSPWWLISSIDDPAYRYIKYSFDKMRGAENLLFCSVYIEKGIGQQISELYTSAQGKEAIMTPDWAWYWFIDNLKSGQVAAVISKLSNDLNLPVNIHIETSYYVDSPSWDPHDSNLPHNSYQFQFESASNALALRESNTSTGIEDGLALITSQIKSISDLSLILSKMSTNPWLWVDVMIGLSFNPEPPIGTNTGLIWNADIMWVKFLSKFRDWLTAKGK